MGTIKTALLSWMLLSCLSLSLLPFQPSSAKSDRYLWPNPTIHNQVIAEDVARAIEAIAPLDSGILGDELGFLFGDRKTPVRAIGCMWMAHPQSVRKCIESGINMIVCHESMWYPAQTSPWYDGPTLDHIFVNRTLRELLEQNKLVVYRSHSNWDALFRDGVHDQAVATLGLPGLTEIARQKFFAVERLPQPMAVKSLQAVVKSSWGYADCRVFGDADRKVRQFAVLIGGFGGNQIHMPQAAVEMGAEAIIIGEMNEGILLACLEMGVPVIETLHSISETPGVKRQAALLAQRFPDIPVKFIPSGAHTFPSQVRKQESR